MPPAWLRLFACAALAIQITSLTILPPGDWSDDYSQTDWSMPSVVNGTAFAQYHGWFYQPPGQSQCLLNLTRNFSQPFEANIAISYTFVWGCDPEGTTEKGPGGPDWSYTYIDDVAYFNNTLRGTPQGTPQDTNVQWHINDTEITRHCSDDNNDHRGKEIGFGLNASFTFHAGANQTWSLRFQAFLKEASYLVDLIESPWVADEYWGVTNLRIYADYTMPPSEAPTDGPTALPTTPSPITAEVSTSRATEITTTVTFGADTETTNSRSSLMMAILISAATCTALCLLVCLVRRLCQKHRRMLIMQEQEEMARMNSQSDQPGSIHAQREDVEEMNAKNKLGDEKLQREHEGIRQWLVNEVQLSQYLKAFTSNGYDSLEFIKEIASSNELMEIGIRDEEHRQQLLMHIRALGMEMHREGE